MKTNITVTDLTLDEIVTILADATYGESVIDIKVPEEYNDLYVAPAPNKECWEDKLANVLLNGGSIEIVDIESAEPKDYHIDSNLTTVWEEFEPWFVDDEDEPVGHIGYIVNLQDFLNGCSKGYDDVKELLNGDGDFYTAYNIIQYIIFGEVVYG